MNKSCIYEFDKSTVSSRLIRWGEWKMRSGVALGYPSMAAFMRLGGTQPSDLVGIVDEIDSECVETDRAVNDLPYIPSIVVRVEYLSGYRDSAKKAYSCGVSKRAYYNYLDHARELIANNLNLNLRIVHKNDINLLNVSLMRPA